MTRSFRIAFFGTFLLLAEGKTSVAKEIPSSVLGKALPSPEDVHWQAKDEVIVITGNRSRQAEGEEAAATTEVIARSEIEQSGAENVAELLRDHPGVDLTPGFRGSSVRMQGLDPSYVLVLVDGERSLGRIGGSIDLSRFSIENVEQVEIIKGASSALYGSDALAGVINIITKKSQKPIEASVHSSYGSFATTDLSSRIGLQGDKVSGYLSAGMHRGDGYDLDPSDIATTSSNFAQYRAEASAAYQMEKDSRISILGDVLRRDQSGVDISAAGAVFDRDSATEIAKVSLRGLFRPQGSAGKLASKLAVSRYVDQYYSNQRGSDALDTYERAVELLGQGDIQYERQFGNEHFLVAGTEVLGQSLDSPRLDSKGQRGRLAFFAQDEWDFLQSPRVTLVAGARLDIDTQFGVQPAPKFGMRWDLLSNLVFRQSYAWGFRAPSFQEQLLRFENPSVGYRVQGNPGLEPERSQSLNASLDWEALDSVHLSGSVFYNSIDNLIGTDLVETDAMDGTQVFGYVNVASARSRGGELQLRIRRKSGLHGSLSYALTDTLDKESGFPLPGRAKHRGSAHIAYRHTGLGSDIALRGSVYSPRRYRSESETNQTDPYALVGLRAQKDIGRYLRVFAGADNLLNAGEATLLPLPPRSIYGGLTAAY